MTFTPTPIIPLSAGLTLDNLCLSLTDTTHSPRTLLQDTPLNVQIAPGEVVTLMGPSGCGKSTLLHALIGALAPAFTCQGRLWLNGRELTGLPVEQRQIGILFQDDLLFPHLSVGANLAFALPATEKRRRQAIITQALADAGLEGFADRDPATLSGGQRARVSVLRALLAQPQALLLDEPFSRLDRPLRRSFREFVYRQIRLAGLPTLLVTHDADDIPPNGQVIMLGDPSQTESANTNHAEIDIREIQVTERQCTKKHNTKKHSPKKHGPEIHQATTEKPDV